MKTRLTEKQVSRAFRAAIKNGAWTAASYPDFYRILPEMDCQQGRPDYVASPTNITILPRTQRIQLASVLALPSSARILSLLKADEPCSESFLLQVSGLSCSVFRRSIRKLQSFNFVVQPVPSEFILSPKFPSLNWELWAFEVKVDHWKRALYQTLQYQAFAHYVMVAISKQYAHRVDPHIDLFKTLGVGIMAVDHQGNTIHPILRPRRRKPRSTFHYYYALGKFLTPKKRGGLPPPLANRT